MWLRLDLDGLDFQFRIVRYHQSTKRNWDEEWCDVDLSMIAPDWLNYHIDSREILLCCEVEELRDRIDDLLNDRIREETEISFIEPDLSFRLFPRSDKRENPNVIYVKPGHEWSDVLMDLEVHTWNHILTENRIMTCFGREEIKFFLCYLRLVCGDVDREDPQVKQYIAEGKIYSTR